MKNWLPLVFGPLLAMETTPRAECFRSSRSSSANLWPHTLVPPCVRVSARLSIGTREGKHLARARRVAALPSERQVSRCPRSRGGGTPAHLNHEPLDVSVGGCHVGSESRSSQGVASGQGAVSAPMELCVVIPPACGQSQEILRGARHLVAVQFDFQVAKRRVQRHRLQTANSTPLCVSAGTWDAGCEAAHHAKPWQLQRAHRAGQVGAKRNAGGPSGL